jgi:hypothetical protein
MRIHIHANCQAVPLAGMLNEAYPEWKISFFEVHAQPIIDHLDQYYDAVRTADVVLSQPIHDGFRAREDLSLKWVKANVHARASLIVIPSLHFAAHQPSWEGNPFPGFDLLGAHLVASGLEPDLALQRLLDLDLLTDAEIDREIDTAIAETVRRERDDEIDIKISPFLNENARVRMIFHLSNHPLRETTVWVANAVIERLGFPKRVSVAGYDYQGDPHIPPLPTITRYLAARSGTTPDPSLYDTVRLHSVAAMPLEAYYRQMIERWAAVPADELFAMIAGRWPTIQVLRRLAENNSTIPGIGRWRS